MVQILIISYDMKSALNRLFSILNYMDDVTVGIL